MKRVTVDNAVALQSEIIKIKMSLDAKVEDRQVVRNRTAYIIKSLNTFFAGFRKGEEVVSKSTAAPKDNADYRRAWSKVVQEMYKSIPQEDADTIFRNSKFSAYNAQDGELYLRLDLKAYNMLRMGYIGKLAECLRMYLNKGFKCICPTKA